MVKAAEREFGVASRTAREYVRAAYERIRAAREETKPFDFDRMVSIKLTVLENAMADRDRAILLLEEHGSAGMEPGDQAKIMGVAVRAMAVANGASDQLTKMHGGYAPERVEHSGELSVAALTPAEREARIKTLLAKRGGSAGGG